MTERAACTAYNLSDPSGFLRWDDVDDIPPIAVKIGDQHHRTDVDRVHFAAFRQRYPFEVRVQLLPGVLEQPLLRERVLGVEDD